MWGKSVPTRKIGIDQISQQRQMKQQITKARPYSIKKEKLNNE